MKKLKFPLVFFLTVFIVVLPLMAGCSTQAKPQSAVSETLSGSLTVYYISSQQYEDGINSFKSFYPDVQINAVSFDTASDMDLRISTEFGTGKGPDVILLNSESTTLDTFKMAKNGAFYDMSTYFNDESQKINYFSGVLSCGQINSAQYLVPIGFDIPTLYTSEEILKKRGITLGDTYTFDEFAQAIEKEAEKCTGDDSHAAIAVRYTDENIMPWLESAGIQVDDRVTDEITATKDQLKEVADLAKSIYTENSKGISLVNKCSKFAAASNAVTFFMENGTFALDSSYFNYMYESEKSETMRFINVPELSGAGKLCGVVSLYGAVNANTQNPYAAYMLFKCIMNYCNTDLYYGSIGNYPTSVNKDLVMKQIDVLATHKNGGGELFFTEPFETTVKDALNSVDSFVIPDNSVSEIVETAFLPYLKGKQSFDSCYSDFTTKLSTYLNE